MLGELNRWPERYDYDEEESENRRSYESDSQFERDKEDGWHWAVRVREELLGDNDDEWIDDEITL